MADHHTDLPLFRWTPPKVQIIPFPTRNRVGHIRRTASRIYHSRTNREAEAYWHRAIEGLRRQMEKAGVPEGRIEVELRAFADCVQHEVARIGHREVGQPDGGAA